jgi:hypothetical protein
MATTWSRRAGSPIPTRIARCWWVLPLRRLCLRWLQPPSVPDNHGTPGQFQTSLPGGLQAYGAPPGLPQNPKAPAAGATTAPSTAPSVAPTTAQRSTIATSVRATSIKATTTAKPVSTSSSKIPLHSRRSHSNCLQAGGTDAFALLACRRLLLLAGRHWNGGRAASRRDLFCMVDLLHFKHMRLRSHTPLSYRFSLWLCASDLLDQRQLTTASDG